jgi:hypothetical protein
MRIYTLTLQVEAPDNKSKREVMAELKAKLNTFEDSLARSGFDLYDTELTED